jgi:hypothetical protein
MTATQTLDELWDAPSVNLGTFAPENYHSLPACAQRYLAHALAPGTRLASAVRLTMHGEIKLKKEWLPFSAEQVIRQERGFLWNATVTQGKIPIRGSDKLIDGVGEMNWKLWGIFSVMNAMGANVTRSAIGRFQVESVWLPSTLCAPEIVWIEGDATHAIAQVTTLGEKSDLTLTVDTSGRALGACLMRWGNPTGIYRFVPFGGIFDEERTFDGVTIPTRVRVGWHVGSERFETDGEFFRAALDAVHFR